MSDTSSSSNRGGIGFVSLLTILFVGLKLTGHITWSWLWVLSPMWISIGIVVVCFLVLGAIAYLVAKSDG